MKEQTCAECQHFRQHYGFDGQQYEWLNCGHCVFPRIKKRLPDTRACEQFLKKANREQTANVQCRVDQGTMRCVIALTLPLEGNIPKEPD